MSRAALVTGGDSGIGSATAAALAGAGFDVAVTWRSDAAGAAETAGRVRAAGGRAYVHRLDLRRDGEPAAAVGAAVEHLGRLDVLVNNAAVNARGAVLEQSLGGWREALEVNLTGAFACSQAAARHMVARGSGAIVNVTSVHEHVPLRGAAAYAASKAALGMLTKVMALELAEHGIAVNSVAPGHVATPMNGFSTPRSAPRSGIPAGRIALPEEVASAVAYLVADGSRYVTGHSLVVDGGLLLMAVDPLRRELAAVEAR